MYFNFATDASSVRKYWAQAFPLQEAFPDPASFSGPCLFSLGSHNQHCSACEGLFLGPCVLGAFL